MRYQNGGALDLDEVLDLYRDSTLAQRRPVEDRPSLEAMMRHANLVITAWEDRRLVGIARSFSDFSHVTYLADLAVRKAFQKKGVGKELVRLTREAGGKAMIVLLAAPAAEGYYPRLGFAPHPSAWVLRG